MSGHELADGAPGVVSSVDELDELLRRDGGVPRGVRRRIVSDARRISGFLQCEGVPVERVRFRIMRCTDCGELELKGYSALGHVH